MNARNGGFLRFPQIGTASAMKLASPMTGRHNTRFREKTMTYEAKNARNAFLAVTVAFFASAILMAGAVGPAIA